VQRAIDSFHHSIAQPRPRYFAFVGSSGLPIGVVGDALTILPKLTELVAARKG